MHLSFVKSRLEKGATRSTHAAYLRTWRIQQIQIWIYRISIFTSFLFIWQWTTEKGWLDPFLVSNPRLIWNQALSLLASGELLHHIAITASETMVGFLLGTTLGICLATLLWVSPLLSRVLDPYLVVINSMPKVALGPFFLITLGAGFASILAMAISITIIVTALVICNCFRQVDQNYLIFARSLGATRWQIFYTIIFPACLPDMMAALKVNIGLAWVGVIVGEFLVSKAGLGYLIIYGFQVFNLHLVMLSLLIVALIATIMYQMVSWLEHRFHRPPPSFHHKKEKAPPRCGKIEK
jgi:NitT/TauT family transport system permease protein